jgi:hypothetical protein
MANEAIMVQDIPNWDGIFLIYKERKNLKNIFKIIWDLE